MGYPENAGYMVAAYVVGTVILLSYGAILFFRLRRAQRGRPWGKTFEGPTEPPGRRIRPSSTTPV